MRVPTLQSGPAFDRLTFPAGIAIVAALGTGLVFARVKALKRVEPPRPARALMKLTGAW